MRNVLWFPVALATLVALSAPRLAAGDWLTLPSSYTHDPLTGMRVGQFAPAQPAVAPSAPGFTRSGYTHLRSTIQVGQSQDNYHRVDQWGAEVRPYGEWRYPYRPYSVPYPGWGAPLAGLELGGRFGGYPYPPRPGTGGYGNYGGPGGGYPWQTPPGQPNTPYPTDPDGPYPVAPWYDGYYPSYPHRLPRSDQQFFQPPIDADVEEP